MTPFTKYHQTVADIFFPIQHLRRMYLTPSQFQVLFYPPKTSSAMYTWDLAARKYLFSSSKSEAGDIFGTCPTPKV